MSLLNDDDATKHVHWHDIIRCLLTAVFSLDVI